MMPRTAPMPALTESVVVEREDITAEEPLLVMGLPGIGFVSKLAADHLVKTLKAKHFATLYSPHFPNQVLAMRSGRLRPFNMKFYHAKVKKRDVIVLRGDLQPLTVEGQYEVVAKTLAYAAGKGATEVVAMAGYALNQKVDKPTIYCTSTSKELFQRYLRYGAKRNDAIVPIIGLAGMVPALAPLYGMRGSCLLVETPGTGIDATGASALIDFLAKPLGQRIETTNLKERAAKAADIAKKIEEQTKLAEERKVAGTPEAARKEALTYIR
jgi:uncharacterized protein (TIGR00162 family)